MLVRVIDVTLIRAELRPADVAVVIDVLRATSTITQAIAAGYERVLCTDSLDRAQSLRRAGRVLAGERHCVKPPGFDQGNSPADAAHRRGSELVLATTNGAPTIVAAARSAPRVLVACLLNLDSVLTALKRADPAGATVQIACSGTDDSVALEDVYVAGRLSRELPGPRTDATLVAELVARAFETPLEALRACADARALIATGLSGDIEYCARESELAVVPQVVEASEGVAVLTNGR